MSDQRENDVVLHQSEHEELIDERVADALDGAGTANEAIEDLDEITGGQSPTEGEHNAVVVAVNDILAALRNSSIIPETEE